MQVGQRGFLVTCNFKEKECIKESYNLFNSYLTDEAVVAEPDEEKAPVTSDADEDDISTQLAKEIKASKAAVRERIFQAVDTQTANCIFIEAKIEDPLAMAVKIVRDIAETKVARTRFLLRLIPVEIVCKANIVDIMTQAAQIFDKHFLTEPKSYAIIFNRRYNNDIKRDHVIKELADIIQAKNLHNKVDLKNPQLAVIVEVIKGFCCLSVLPDYYLLKKYNLVELCANNANPVTTAPVDQKAEEPE